MDYIISMMSIVSIHALGFKVELFYKQKQLVKYITV